jgi:hypothetical protein
MELTLFLSAKITVSYNVRFGHFCTKKLYYFFAAALLMHTVQKSSTLLYKEILNYKIIPPCNTWHTSAISGVVKQLERLKTLFYYSARKVHIFATLFRHSTLLIRGIEK